MSTIAGKTHHGHKTRGSSELGTEIQEYQTRLEILYEVAQQASSVGEISGLLEEILRVTQRILRASASSLLLINEEKGEFYLQAAGGDKSSILKQVQLGLDSGIVGWVAHHGTALIVNDAYRDKRFNRHVDEATGFITRSVIATPITRGKDVIGVLEIVNKVDGSDFTEQDLNILSGFSGTEALILLVSMASTALNNIKLCEALQEDYKSTVETLVNAVDAKDPYAGGHSRRVKEYALIAAKNLDFGAEEMQTIEFGALLHDIGKIGIADSILLKAEPLTPGEWYIIRKHALRGANIVGEIPCLAKARESVLHHHEHFDGTGYPGGLKGEEIPLSARVIAVADAFDTMTTDHSYRKALSAEDSIRELIRSAGTQFCPAVVDAFIKGFQELDSKLVISPEDRKSIERAKQEAGKARRAREAAEAAVEEPEEMPEPEEKSGEINPPTSTELYHGDLEIIIKSPADFKQINRLKKALRNVPDLKIILDGWSEDEGSFIMVSLQKEMPLGTIIREIAGVAGVYHQQKNLLVGLQSPGGKPEK
ncbi:MAG: HD domain-containing phosphohydrolase [Chloroflexota bacterium]